MARRSNRISRSRPQIRTRPGKGTNIQSHEWWKSPGNQTYHDLADCRRSCINIPTNCSNNCDYASCMTDCSSHILREGGPIKSMQRGGRTSRIRSNTARGRRGSRPHMRNTGRTRYQRGGSTYRGNIITQGDIRWSCPPGQTTITHDCTRVRRDQQGKH